MVDGDTVLGWSKMNDEVFHNTYEIRFEGGRGFMREVFLWGGGGGGRKRT